MKTIDEIIDSKEYDNTSFLVTWNYETVKKIAFEFANQAINLCIEHFVIHIPQQDFINGKYVDRIEITEESILKVKELLK